jgi:hypothetical protein
MMSATILENDAFFKSLGLAPEVKFIREKKLRQIFHYKIGPLYTAYLNFVHLLEERTKHSMRLYTDQSSKNLFY